MKVYTMLIGISSNNKILLKPGPCGLPVSIVPTKKVIAI
jgi:hypothetical protein